MDERNWNQRLLRLERQNRRLRRLFFGLVVLAGTVPLMGLAVNDQPRDAHYRIVYASKFALKDPRTGKVRAELAHQTAKGGWAGLTLWDNDGEPRAELKLWEDGRCHLQLMDENRRELWRVAVSADGEPSIARAGKPVSLE